jgi:hypothetical protein
MGTPRDFLEGSFGSTKQNYQPRDFLETGLPEETFSQSAKYAPFRVGEDLINAGRGALENAPDYWERGKTEVPAFLNPINGLRHPVTRSKNVIAGLAELGHGILNTPHDFANYLENRLNLLPRGWSDKVPYQDDISGALDQFTGKEMNPGDSLTRGIVRNAANIIPVTKAASVLNPLNLTAKNIAKDVLKTRERNIGNYGNRYENLWKEAEGKGFGDALYHIDIDMPTIKKYSPNKSIKGLEDFDANPTLQNAHAAKSDLLRIKRDLDKLTTLRTAERQQLGAVNNAINSINENMFKEPSGKIHEGMKQKYGELQEGYRNEVVPYKNKAINEFMRDEASADELVNSLSKKAFYAKRGKYHTGMRLRKLIKSHPYLAGIGAAGALGAGGLFEEIFGKKK